MPPLLRDPIGWARECAGDSGKFAVGAVAHAVVCVFALLRASEDVLLAFLLFAGVFPILYLYALRRALLKLAELTSDREIR